MKAGGEGVRAGMGKGSAQLDLGRSGISIQMEKVRLQTNLTHLSSLFDPNLRNDRKSILNKSKAVL